MKKLALVTVALVACGGGQKPQPEPQPQPEPAMPVEPPPMADQKLAPPEAPVAKGNPDPNLIPRSVFFGNPERANVQISPDGKNLAWLAPKDGVMNVFVAPIGNLGAAKPVTSDTKRPIRQFFWAYTNKHILYQQDAAGDENFHVFRADIADGKTTDLTPFKGARASVEGLSWKQPTKLLVTINDRDPQVFDLYEVESAERRAQARRAERRQLPRVPDGQRDEAAPGDEEDARRRDARVLAETKAGKITWKPWEQIPFEDADTTSIVGLRAGQQVDLRDREPRPRHRGARRDRSRDEEVEGPRRGCEGGRGRRLLAHPKNDNVQAVGFDYDKPAWQALDKSIQARPRHAREARAPAAVRRRRRARSTTRRGSSRRRAVEDGPATYYLWDRGKQKADVPVRGAPELEKQPLVEDAARRDQVARRPRPVSYLTLPKAADADEDGKADKPVPMVLLVHGGPWARDAWGFNPLHQLLANRGYAVL